MTSTGKYTALLERLPNDVATLVRIVQGLTSMNTSQPRSIASSFPTSARANLIFERSNGCWIAFSPSTVAAECWAQCGRSGANPAKFGIFKGDLRGLWFIAANLVHDMAALNKFEMLCWDVWGAMPHPDTPLRDNAMAFFDELN
jgi:hypothetical protein